MSKPATNAARQPVNARDGRTTSRQKRFGAVIGGRIMQFVRRRYTENGQGVSASTIAARLTIEESYVRRICRAFVEDGLISVCTVEQKGTRPVQLYSPVE